jgi:MSHA biogenesis protein MshJ
LKNWWKLQSTRINGLTLRERAFLLLSVMATLIALADVVWLSPAQTMHNQLKQRFTKQSAELERLRSDVKADAAKPNPAKLAHNELLQVQSEIAAVNGQIKLASSSAGEGTPLAQVLEQFLRRYGGLTLLRTTTLSPESVVAKVGQGAGVPVGLSRQGLELTVSGPYAELVAYVQTLEKALPTLRWGTLRLASDNQPPQLSLQVFVMGGQP